MQFQFALKVPKAITHDSRLKGIEETWQVFIERAIEGLSDKLGPCLFQLPPSLHKDMSKLTALCETVRSTAGAAKIAIEFRSVDWFCAEVYAVLQAENWALVENYTADNSLHYCDQRTANWTYTRWHGIKDETGHWTNYSDTVLQAFAEQVLERDSSGTAAQYIYFLNDVDAAAVQNAQTLGRMVLAQLGRAQLVNGFTPAVRVTPASVQDFFKPKAAAAAIGSGKATANATTTGADTSKASSSDSAAVDTKADNDAHEHVSKKQKTTDTTTAGTTDANQRAASSSSGINNSGSSGTAHSSTTAADSSTGRKLDAASNSADAANSGSIDSQSASGTTTATSTPAAAASSVAATNTPADSASNWEAFDRWSAKETEARAKAKASSTSTSSSTTLQKSSTTPQKSSTSKSSSSSSKGKQQTVPGQKSMDAFLKKRG
jgi:uncharacterized protein YecE (DUF72 family)